MHPSRKTRRWLIGLALGLVLAGLRLPWRNADGGNWAYWSYAFFVSDEQLYTDGGRLAVLTSRFLDPEMGDPPSFLGSWGMHFLAYLGYRLDGFTLSAERWPTMILAILGWLAAYVIVSRRTDALLAGILVLLISSNPASLTYERVASTDIVIGTLAVIAYALATSRALWKTCLAGFCMAFALSVKPTALAFLPLFGLAILVRSDQRWRRLFFGVAALLISFGVLWAARQACIHAVVGNGHPQPVLVEAGRGASMLDNLDYHPSHWLKSLSIFPRWPIVPQLGLLATCLFALPVWFLCLHWHQTGRIFSSRTVSAWGLLFYLLPFGTQFLNPLRYFLAAVFLLPEIVVASRPAGRYLRQARPRAGWFLGGVVITMFFLYWIHGNQSATAEMFRAHLYNEFTLPAESAWGVLGIRLGISFVLMVIGIGWILRRQSKRHAWLVVLGLALAFSWMFFNSYTISLLTNSAEFAGNQFLFQAGLIVTLGLLLYVRSCRWLTWYLIWAACFLVFVSANTYWRTGYRDVWRRQFYVRDLSQELQRLLPPNSMVIGRRAPLLLRNTKLRIGLETFAYSPTEFLGRVRHLLDRHPGRPLYWLIDGDGCPTWDDYRQETNHNWTVKLVKTFWIPSGDTLDMQAVEGDKLPLVPIQLLRVTKP